MWMGSSQTWPTALSSARPRSVPDFSLSCFPVSQLCRRPRSLFTVCHQAFLFSSVPGQPSDRPKGRCHQSCPPVCWGRLASSQARQPGEWVGGGRSSGEGLLYGMAIVWGWEALFRTVGVATCAESWESALSIQSVQWAPVCNRSVYEWKRDLLLVCYRSKVRE